MLTLPQKDFFVLQKKQIYALPILHHTMELAAIVKLAFDTIKPDCIAVELPETLQNELFHAAARLPDISVVCSANDESPPLYYLCEPCDPAFEGLRCGHENQIPSYCIDLDLSDYPEITEPLPDPYVIQRIGLKHYYESYKKISLKSPIINEQDKQRELYMAKRLKELTFSYERILFISGMSHTERVLSLVDNTSFPNQTSHYRSQVSLCTLTEKSCREVLPEFGWIAKHYEETRSHIHYPESHIDDQFPLAFLPDRQKLLYNLYKKGGEKYTEATGHHFEGYHLRNIMKFARNYALITSRLMPDLFQTLSAAKGCVDHNYAYEVWELATEYPYLKNVDNLPQLDLTVEDLWKHRKMIKFHRKAQNPKSLNFHKRKKHNPFFKLIPPSPFTICSYPKEDVVIENFGEFLKKKSIQISSEEGAQTIPFTSSLEDGLDVRETIRHWHEKRLYVKVRGKPPGRASSVVMIFDEDKPEDEKIYTEKYPWKATWIGEHNQESDMALFATDMRRNVVGPGISRCEYGGFMLSSPPRRMFDVWSDGDYSNCRSKAEVLLMAAIDYAIEPIVVFVAERPPRSALKSYASRFGKKIVYIPIGQISPIMLNKIRVFHVLDGHDKRAIADEYIW